MTDAKSPAGKSKRFFIKSQTNPDDKKEKSDKIDNKERRMMEPPIKTKPFKIKNKFSKDEELRDEYLEQLKGQENGLKNLTIAEYFENREAYKKNGRSDKGSQAQKVARELALADKIDELREEDSNLTLEDAKKQAKEWLKTQAALHDPDQIAGGNPEKIFYMGNARINSSIGSQWKSRADDVEDQVRKYIKDNNIPESEYKYICLNIEIPSNIE